MASRIVHLPSEGPIMERRTLFEIRQPGRYVLVAQLLSEEAAREWPHPVQFEPVTQRWLSLRLVPLNPTDAEPSVIYPTFLPSRTTPRSP